MGTKAVLGRWALESFTSISNFLSRISFLRALLIRFKNLVASALPLTADIFRCIDWCAAFRSSPGGDGMMLPLQEATKIIKTSIGHIGTSEPPPSRSEFDLEECSR